VIVGVWVVEAVALILLIVEVVLKVELVRPHCIVPSYLFREPIRVLL